LKEKSPLGSISALLSKRIALANGKLLKIPDRHQLSLEISKGVRIHSKSRSLIEKRVVKKNRDMNYYNVILLENGNNEIVLKP